MTLNSIKNPYSVRNSDPFIIQVYKDWDGVNGPTNLIMESRKVISKDLF